MTRIERLNEALRKCEMLPPYLRLSTFSEATAAKESSHLPSLRHRTKNLRYRPVMKLPYLPSI